MGPAPVVVVTVLLAACSAPTRSSTPSPHGEQSTIESTSSCNKKLATAHAHRERGELRAALAALAHVPDRRVLRSLAEATPCPAGDELAKALRTELQLDVALAPASAQAAAESRALHAAALEALALGKHDDAIRDLEAAHGKWPHPQLQAAIASAHRLVGRGTPAQIAADRAIALAERIGGAGTLALRRGHGETVRHVMYDDTGRWLVSAAGSELVVWDHATGAVVRRLETKDAPSPIVALQLVDKSVLAISEDGMLRLWDIHRGHPIATRELGAGYDAVEISPDGALLVLAGGGSLRVEQRATGTLVWKDAAPDQIFAFADGGKTLVTAGFEGKRATLSIREVATGHVSKKLAVPGQVERGDLGNDPVNDVAVSPDGKLLAAAGADRVHVWDRASGRKLVSFAARDWPGDVRFVDNERLETEGEVFVARTGKKIGKSPGCGVVHPRGGERACPASSAVAGIYPRGIVLYGDDGSRRELGYTDVAFTPRTLDISPDGKSLTIAHGKEPVLVSLATGQLKAFARLRGLAAVSVANDRRLALAAGRQLVVLDEAGARVRALDFPSSVFTVAFRPDGKALALTTESELVVVDAASWNVIRREKIGFQVRTIGWSSDGTRLYAHATQQLGKVWDATTGREVASFAPAIGIAMAPDAKRVGIVRNDATTLDLENGSSIALTPPADRILGATLALLPDGASLLVARRDELAWLDARAQPRTMPWPPGGFADQLAIHPNKRLAFASNSQRHVIAIDLATFAPRLTIAIGEAGAWGAFDAKGRFDGNGADAAIDIVFGGTISLPASLDTMRRRSGLVAEALGPL